MLFASLVSRNLVNNKILHRSNLRTDGLFSHGSRHTVCHHGHGLAVGLVLDDNGGKLLAYIWETRKQRQGIFLPSLALCQVPQSMAWNCSHSRVGSFLGGGAFHRVAGTLNVCPLALCLEVFSTEWPLGRMQPRIAMTSAQHKRINVF